MSTNNNEGNDQTGHKKTVPSPTIGDAVKEALETGKEVAMQGPMDTGDFNDIKDIISNAVQPNESSSSKEIDKGIALSVDDFDSSKLEINVRDIQGESPLVEDKIVVNPQKEEDEATVEAVTTISTEGLDVKVKTDVDVPVKDENKNTESDTKVFISSPDLTTVPIDQSQFQSSSQFPSSQSTLKDDSSISFNNQENSRTKDEYTHKNIQSNISLPNSYNGIQPTGQMNAFATKDATHKYLEFQNQFLNSFQSVFSTFIENTNNMFINGQIYFTHLQEMYSKMATLYTENTVTLTKMLNNITAANTFAFGSFFNVPKAT